MPRVTFLRDNLTVEVPMGASLKDVVDQCGASLPFGCRIGTCGTCRCVIIEGMENLNAMTPEEKEMFESFTSVGKNERLGCQLTILKGHVKIQY